MANLTRKEKARIRTAKYRLIHPEKVKAAQQLSNKKNPDAARERNNRWVQKHPGQPSVNARKSRTARKYGENDHTYAARLISQNGHCALCPKTPEQQGTRLAWDHDPSKTKGEPGFIRGLLCMPCNTALGKLGDNEAGLSRALAYVRGER